MWWAVAGAVVLGLIALSRMLLMVTVVGDSMVPTLHRGDRVLAIRGRLLLRRDRLVVFEVPQSGRVGERDGAGGRAVLAIKRVTAVAGDPQPPVRGEPSALAVPARHLFVVGDAAQSLDSLTFGSIPYTAVHAVVVSRWSPSAGRGRRI